MTNNIFDENNEKRLVQFLKDNTPVPPAMPFGEKERILRKILTAEEEARTSFKEKILAWLNPRLLVPAAVTALVLFAFLTTPTRPAGLSDAQMIAYLNETMGSVDEPTDPFSDNGFLLLAEIVSRSDG